MKAATWQGKRSVAVEEVPDPVIMDPTDAIIKVTSTCICGSDLHLYEVLAPVMEKGDVLGHESIGIVQEIGSEIKDLKIGDQVDISNSQINESIKVLGTLTGGNTSDTDEILKDGDESKVESKVDSSEAQADSSKKSDKSSGVDSLVVVEVGDTYIELVREMVVSTSGAENLTPAQKIAIETIVASQAGMPYVIEGAYVTISIEAISNALEQVKSMSDDQLALWEAYLPGSGL